MGNFLHKSVNNGKMTSSTKLSSYFKQTKIFKKFSLKIRNLVNYLLICSAEVPAIAQAIEIAYTKKEEKQ